MTISARLKKIEKTVFTKKRDIVWVNEGNDGYYIQKENGEKVRIENLGESFPGMVVYIERDPL